jgi:hypothetical protein
MYHGGLNIGIFYPGSPNSPSGSDLIGNIFGSKSATYTSTADGAGGNDYAWAIIVAPSDIDNFIMRKPEEIVSNTPASIYDGLFNKNLTSTTGVSRISRYKKGGYTDWYIPSVNELAFIAKNLPKNFELEPRFSPLRANSYLSSTYVGQNVLATKKKNVSLLLAQSFYTPTYGDTIVVPDYKPMSVRLIRRVLVSNI